MKNIVEIIKVSVGPILAVVVGWLAYEIIKGQVTSQNSFGLNGIFTILGGLVTTYAAHYYGPKDNGS